MTRLPLRVYPIFVPIFTIMCPLTTTCHSFPLDFHKATFFPAPTFDSHISIISASNQTSMAMSISREWRCSHRDNYQVTFFNHQIAVVVTHVPKHFRRWISRILAGVPRRRCRCCGTITRLRSRLVVGLDVEWRPNFSGDGRRKPPRNPVALLQLCVGEECLIFQLQYAEGIPKCVIDFLKSDDFIFVGVGIDNDALKLLEDYDLEVKNTIDLRKLASWELGRHELRHAGLTGLAREVLGLEYDKPKKITLSEWDKPYLSKSQVQYASIDAFLSFSIGWSLTV